MKHTLSFRDAVGTTPAPFKFASNLDGTLIDTDTSGKSYLPTTPTGSNLCGSGDTLNAVPKSLTTIGAACYTYTTTDKVNVAEADFTAGSTPSIVFQLPSSRNGLNSGSATITIRYHVWAYSGKHDHVNTAPDADTDPKKIHTVSETLRLNIHKCVVTSDCPINSGS